MVGWDEALSSCLTLQPSSCSFRSMRAASSFVRWHLQPGAEGTCRQSCLFNKRDVGKPWTLSSKAGQLLRGTVFGGVN